MNLPENSASMGDAARTREDEKGDICTDCDGDPATCKCDSRTCEYDAIEAAGDLAVKARKEGS